MYAFGGGNSGEFKKTNVVVSASKTLNLGNLTWTIERTAPTVFEIGIPNRDTKEFKNGDYNYSQWQNYIDIPTDYPNGVNYTVGTSDWAKDWNYGLTGANSWNINFNLKEAPFSNTNASLYLAFANNFRTRLDVYVNGTKVNASPIYPINGSDAMIRLGSHGLYSDMRIAVPTNLFVKGVNKIKITQSGGEVEFDYLRLEADIPNVVLTKSGPSTFCDGGSLTITSSSGKSYRWFNGAALLSNISQSLNVTLSGSYKVEVTNANGTKDTSDIVTVVVNPLPVLNAYVKIDAGAWRTDNTPLVCKGGTVSFGPTPTNATGWSWAGPNSFSSSSRTPILSNTVATQAGSYIASFTDVNGCKASTQYDLTVSVPLAQITTTASSFCSGNDLILTANSGKAYKWFNSTTQVGTSSTYTATAAGTFAVEVTNSDGCKDTSIVKTIIVNPVPVISITSPANNTTLTSDIFPINATVTGTNISNVSFYNGASLLGTDATSPYSFITPSLVNGSYTFFAIAKNTFNCTDTAKVTVKVNKVVTGMEDKDVFGEIQCFPNPFQDNLNLKAEGKFFYFITDMLGNEIEKGLATGNVSVGHSLPNGLYVIKIQTQNLERSIKVSKVR